MGGRVATGDGTKSLDCCSIARCTARTVLHTSTAHFTTAMSCLFISLGRLLAQPHKTVRQTLCDHMERHLDTPFQGMAMRDWIRWQLDAPSPEAYIRTMRSTSVWGGAMELMVATQVYVTDILVVDRAGERVAEFVWRDGFTARRKMVLMWTGNHYEPVRWVVIGADK